ncbi:hypothetical protein B0H11DRAFT_2113217 [Mycena galericulata]|nr:hypothetical protein B0H11DRAFT_2113217 [Mycena galericulata]
MYNRTAFPRLRSLAICPNGSDGTGYSYMYTPFIFSDIAPYLSNLRTWRDPGLPTDFYRTLTRIELRHIPFEMFSTVLHECPSLAHVVAIVHQPHVPANFGEGSISLPQLRSLVLHGWYLDAFTLPNLQRLELNIYDLHLAPTLLAFLRRSNCVLQHLGVHLETNSPDFTQWAADCLHAVPTLTSLTIIYPQSMTKVADLLFLTTPPLLPHLIRMTGGEGQAA